MKGEARLSQPLFVTYLQFVLVVVLVVAVVVAAGIVSPWSKCN